MQPAKRLTGRAGAIALIAGLFPWPGYAATTAKVIYAFKGTADGAGPEAGIILGRDGSLYGTAGRGGSNDNGTIFKLTPPAKDVGRWSLKTLYELGGGQGGGYPLGLVADSDGNLYGYALDFGTSGDYGTVFRLAKSASAPTGFQFETIYRFKGGADGEYPTGLAVAGGGTLIGATSQGGNGPCTSPIGGISGCGTVFKLTPPAKGNGLWTETVLHRFRGGHDGALPSGAPILFAGAYYGVSMQGGAGHCARPNTTKNIGCGVVYKLEEAKSGSWTEAISFSFAGKAQGWGPIDGLTNDGSGHLFGIAEFGGVVDPDGYGKGLAYRLTPKGTTFTYEVLHAFAGKKDGQVPQSGILLGPKGVLYGTTEFGGSGGQGVLYSLTPPGKPTAKWAEAVLASFSTTGSDAYEPTGALAISGSGKLLYGTTLQGGQGGHGTVYQVAP